MDLYNHGNSRMTVNGLSLTLHLPRKLPQRFGTDREETSHELPPSMPRSAFLVDEYVGAPGPFRRSTSTEKSYMIPVLEDRGMWFDFTGNNYHTHDVAAIVSISGINALTAQPVTSTRLEQYRNNCPIHRRPFGHDRFCSECGWKWPAQNYLATTTGKPFWLDGFRTEDGTVRQFYFTEDQARNVAKAVLQEKAVPALGIAFYLSREPKPQPVRTSRSLSFNEGLEGVATRSATRSGSSLGIAAGAKIKQEIGVDNKNPDYWQTEPAGIIIINYVSEAEMELIAAAGKHPQNNEGPFGSKNLPYGS